MGEVEKNIPLEASLQNVFNHFKDHYSGTRVSTELTVLEIIRKAHPGFFVIVTPRSSCDFIGYATAGLATVKTGSYNEFDISRSYVAPRPRLENKSGVLKDQVRFNCWVYSWKDFEFLLYEVEYINTWERPVKQFFVLSPDSQRTNDVHHSAIDKLLLAVGQWTTELHDEIYVFDDGSWNKNRELWKSVQGASWDEVILNPEMKANLMKDVQSFFDSRSLYKKLSVPWKRGVILHGVPGNGKTISIKALIHELQKRKDPIPSLYVKAFDSCNGKKASISSIFSQARTMAPCLLILEDLDSIVEEKERSYFLNEVDGLESNDGILMVGSTNHLDKLDPAISKRPSRFDRKYHFRLPGLEERIAYCAFWRKKVMGSELVEFPESICRAVGEMTDGFSFAYLKELFIIALLTIARGGVETEAEGLKEEVKRSAAAMAVDGEKREEMKSKSMVPGVEIPAELKDNLMLKILEAQIKTLVEEMDNTKEEDLPSERKKLEDSSNGACNVMVTG